MGCVVCVVRALCRGRWIIWVTKVLGEQREGQPGRESKKKGGALHLLRLTTSMFVYVYRVDNTHLLISSNLL